MAAIDFDVVCDRCGTNLDVDVNTRNGFTLKVTPCPECLKEKDDEIKDCDDRIETLENEIETLKETIDALETSIVYLKIEKQTANI